MYIHIYIYIYVCMYVCVRVCSLIRVRSPRFVALRPTHSGISISGVNGQGEGGGVAITTTTTTITATGSAGAPSGIRFRIDAEDDTGGGANDEDTGGGAPLGLESEHRALVPYGRARALEIEGARSASYAEFLIAELRRCAQPWFFFGGGGLR